jgi:hypothetical protein
MAKENPNEQSQVETLVCPPDKDFSKRVYQSPKLTSYGTLVELTRDGGTVNNDGLSGSRAPI